MRIAIGTDEDTALIDAIESHLLALEHEVVRLARGAPWPEVGRAIATTVATGAADFGVVCCYTGTGVAIAANKVPGIRCAFCSDAVTATGARRWNDINVLALSLRLTSVEVASEILDACLSTAPDPGIAPAIAQLEQD